ncbi:hypothetical protein C8Q78DRAFT_1030674 [Trametes maxima]|nr:hypothetical protein C8Q78DRAFT_1030674 [Trametes maxima]
MDGFDGNGKEKATDDALFMERLEMLYQQNLSDLRAFAERESRPFDEVRRRVAELHSKCLFDDSIPAPQSSRKKDLVTRILLVVSQQLESLEMLAGLQSFFLVVDPINQDDDGFLGGSLQGREFWRGHRGCGAAGAQAFKARCARIAPAIHSYHHTSASVDAVFQQPPAQPTAAGNKGSARELKGELYAAMRDALRAASGIRTAEMKWTNHSKLHAYGVRLVGWPANVPLQNPSTLSTTQNKLLLEMLGSGRISFSRLDGTQPPNEAPPKGSQLLQGDDEAMFEDSIDYSWGTTPSDPAAQPTVQRDDSSNATMSTDTERIRQSGMTASLSHSEPGSGADRPITPKRKRVEET